MPLIFLRFVGRFLLLVIPTNRNVYKTREIFCSKEKKMKSRKYQTVGRVTKSNGKNRRNRGEIDTRNTHFYVFSLSWFGAGISTKVAGIN
jgi:ribonuclease I